MAVGSILPMFAVPQAQASAPAYGYLFTWGHNSFGQLGQSDTTTRYSPEQVGAGNDWKVLTAGTHTGFGINNDGELFAWGRNNYGQLGLDDTTDRDTPTRVGTASDWTYVSAGNSHVMAINEDGELWAWGGGHFGRLGFGVGDTADRHVPTRVGTASNWTSVSVQRWHTLATNSQGQLFAWGRNEVGQLGLGDTTDRHVPTRVGTASNWATIVVADRSYIPFADHSHNLALTTNGQLFAWGLNNNGQLGLGDTINRYVPTRVGTASNWSAISANGGFSVALTTSGELWTWGENSLGQLGLGDTTNRHVPTRVGTASNWTTISTSFLSAYAINSYHQLFAWGFGAYGRLGLGDATDRHTPTRIESPANIYWISVASGNNHVVAIGYPRVQGNVPLTKTLRLNEGTIVPGTPNLPADKVSGEATFTFEFSPRQVQLNDDPIVMSRPVSDVPAIANQTITIDPDTATPPVNGVFTATGDSINVWVLVEDAVSAANLAGGVFAWEIRELPNSSNLHSPPDVQMIYDQNRFQIRAHVNTAGLVHAVEVFELNYENGNWIVGDKLATGPNFTNAYTRLVGDEGLPLHNALLISKETRGEFANLSIQFNFTLTLTNPVLTPPVVGDGTTGPVIAQVVQSGTTTPVDPPRAVAIAPGANNFTLAHNESLLIPQLPAGTRFQITEGAHLEYRPEASVTAIPVAPATGSYPEQAVNTALITGTYIIHQVNDNTADFINHHNHIPPTGLLISGTPWVALGATGLLLAVLAANRNRKRIEELPLVF